MEPEFYDTIQHKLSMLSEINRLETFTSWKFDNSKNCSAPKLAEAGFYYTGNSDEPDAVQCFFCDKALDGWDEDDDPWTEHLSHSQNCVFAKLGQPEEALSVGQMTDLHSQLIKKHVEKGMREIVAVIESKFNRNYVNSKKVVNSLKKF